MTHFDEKEALFDAAGKAEAALKAFFYLIPRCSHEAVEDTDALKVFEALRFLAKYRHNALLPNSFDEDRTDGCSNPFCKKIRTLSKG